MSRITKNFLRGCVGDQQSGERIDKVLGELFPSTSRGQFRKIIEFGGVHIDGQRIRRCDLVVKTGQSLEVYTDGQKYQPFSLRPEHIIFHDDYLLVVNKPSGIETQPTPARFKGTLYHAVIQFLQGGRAGQGKASIGMHQRLDRDTSGLLVFSIHPRSHQPLTQAFQQRTVGKCYLALVAGETEPQGEFRSLLARHRRNNLVGSVEKGGKLAVTHFRRLGIANGCSLVRVELETGRTHQIRAHFSEAGHPLLGDGRYDGLEMLGNVSVPRQMLHAGSLSFRHPVHGTMLQLRSSPPSDFAYVWKGLGGEAEILRQEGKLNLSDQNGKVPAC